MYFNFKCILYKRDEYYHLFHAKEYRKIHFKEFIKYVKSPHS